MFKLIIVLSCFISISLCKPGCSSSSGSSGCSSSSSGSGNSSGSSFSVFDNVDIEVVKLPVKVGILDSAFYDCKKRNLYFTDLLGKNIFSYSEKTTKTAAASIPGFAPITFIIPTRNSDDQFIIGVNNSVYLMEWDSISTKPTVLKKLFSVGSRGSMTNHAIAGPKGAIYTGTLSPNFCGAKPTNGFYRWKNGNVETLPGTYKTSNSLAFNYKTNTLYHLDGCQQQLKSFKLNPKTGVLSGGKTILSSFGIPNSVAPVGLSILDDGTLIIGSYKGGILFAVDPDAGEIIDELETSSKYMTDSAFGGGCKNRNVLYVLGSGTDIDINTGSPLNTSLKSPSAGSLLILKGLSNGQGVKKPCASC